MVGGQCADLEGKLTSVADIKEMYALKAGALITAAARMGCLLAGAGEAELSAATEYTKAIGLAFQITDDLLDAEGDSAAGGTDGNGDAGKNTYVALAGAETARRYVEELTRTAIAAAEKYPHPAFLAELARKIAVRVK